MSELRCPATGWTAPVDARDLRGPTGEPLELHVTPGPVSRALFDARLAPTDAHAEREPWQGSGVWRYRELIHPDLPEDAILTRPEGNTPLYRAPGVARWAGVGWLRLKHEGMNPSGSFKDRGMTVAVSQARALGARAIACASTGNTSASAASYAALAGMDAWLLVPEGKTAIGKLSQSMAYGARTVMIRGDFDDAMRMVQQSATELGLYLVNSLNPFRIQGQMSIPLEIVQQLAWDPPDWIALPAGNLGNTAAFGRALLQARDLGLISRVPRLLSVQAAGANPFASAFRRGFDEIVPVKAETLATAIRIGDPVSVRRAIAAIEGTQGHVTEVTDDEILAAKAVVDGEGIGAEPASCASVAGVRQLVERGLIRRDERVVCVLTGHLLKDPETTLAFHEGKHGDSPRRRPPVVIDADLDALRRLVDAAALGPAHAPGLPRG